MEFLLLGLFATLVGAIRRGSAPTPSSLTTDPTRVLREYADQLAGEARAIVPIPLTVASADAGTAYGDPDVLRSLAPSAAGAPLDTPETLGRIASRETPDEPVSVPRELASVPVVTVDVRPVPTATEQRAAAQRLYTIATRTTASSRGPYRAEIRTLQATIGATADGLIGRETSARIRALIGTGIPGL